MLSIRKEATSKKPGFNSTYSYSRQLSPEAVDYVQNAHVLPKAVLCAKAKPGSLELDSVQLRTNIWKLRIEDAILYRYTVTIVEKNKRRPKVITKGAADE